MCVFGLGWVDVLVVVIGCVGWVCGVVGLLIVGDVYFVLLDLWWYYLVGGVFWV